MNIDIKQLPSPEEVELRKKNVEKSLEGKNPLKYVVNIECSPVQEEAKVFFDDPNTGNKWSENIRYKKFIYIKNFDLLDEFYITELRKERERLEKQQTIEKEYYLDNILEYNYYKLLISGQPKGLFKTFYDNIINKEPINELVFNEFFNNYSEKLINKVNRDTLKLIYSKNLPQKTIDSILQTKKEQQQLDKLRVRVWRYFVNLIDDNSINEEQLEILEEKYNNEVIEIEREINKYEEELINIKNIIKKYSKCINEYITEIPAMNYLLEQQKIYNRDNKLFDNNGIIINELFHLEDENGKVYDRLKYGYTHIISTNNSFNTITDFLKNYVHLDLYSEAVKELDLVVKLKLDEQFLIDQEVRIFKGIDQYEQIHRLTFDLETTGLNPAQVKCKSCGKITNIMSSKEIPQQCSNNVSTNSNEIKKCGSVDFELLNTGQIFNIAYKHNRSKEGNVLIAQGKINNDKTFINEEQEKEIIINFFKDVHRINPSIISTYNGEFFDFPFLLYRSKELGIRFEPVKCIKCSTKPLDDNEYENVKFSGSMEPIYQGDKLTHYKCDNNFCGFEVNIDELDKPQEIGKKLNRKCNNCKKGSIIRGNTMYGCDNYNECKTRYDVDFYDSFIQKWSNQLKNYVISSLDYKHPIHKKNYQSNLKLGGEVETYYQTIIYGRTVIDDSHAVRATKAINSNIKSWSLKYIADYKPLKAKIDRTHISGGDIFKIFSDNKYYINTHLNIYKEIPEEYQDKPEEYLNIVNNNVFVKHLDDYNDYFIGVDKNKILNIKVEEVEESDDDFYDIEEEGIPSHSNEEEEEETVTKDEIFTKISCKDYYDENCGKFKLINGEKLISNYALDDVIETEKVGNHYQNEKFASVKFFPMTFQNYAVAGTASSLNIIFIGLRYEKGYSLPHRINRVSLVGGLSRAFQVGFLGDNIGANGIYKLDYSSLYPSLEKALFMFLKYLPFALEVDDMLGYGFDKRFYWKDRKNIISGKKGEISLNEAYPKFLEYIKEDNIETYTNYIEKIYSEGKNDLLKDEILKYEKIADGRQQALKVRFINSIFGAVFSNVPLFGCMEIGNYTTASGRMFLRSSIYHSMVRNCIPTVCDSVTGSTPLILKDKTTGNIKTCPIYEVFDNTKARIDKGQARDFSEKPYKVLTRNGFKDIRYVYKHITTKTIFNVLTRKHFIQVTEDHSLYSNNKLIKGIDIKVGTKIDVNTENINYQTYENELTDLEKLYIKLANSDRYTNTTSFYFHEFKKEYVYQMLPILEKHNIPFTLYKDTATYYKTFRYRLIIHDNNINSTIDVYKAHKLIDNCNNLSILRELIKIYSQGNDCFTIENFPVRDSGSEHSRLNKYINLCIKLNIDYKLKLFHHKTNYPCLSIVIYPNKKLFYSHTDNIVSKINILCTGRNIEVYDISTEDGTFVGGIGRMIAKNTDGFNIVLPKELDKDINQKPLKTPIKFDDLEYKNKKGVDAIIDHFNDNYLPKTTNYMGLALDEIDEKNIVSKRKNYLNYREGKVKEVGNSFKSSNIQNYIKEFLDNKIIKIFELEDLHWFTKEIFNERTRILSGKLTIADVAKKKKNKKTVEEYINRGKNKNGDDLPAEAHMELQIMNNIKPVMGEIVYYVNVANKKSIGDNKYYFEKEYVEQVTKKCLITGKVYKFDYQDPSLNDLRIHEKVKVKDLKKNIEKNCKKIFSLQKKIVSLETTFKTKGKFTPKQQENFNKYNLELEEYKNYLINDLDLLVVSGIKINFDKDQDIDFIIKEYQEYFKTFDDNEEIELTLTKFEDVDSYLCVNPDCNASKNSSSYIVNKGDKPTHCGKITKGVQCNSTTFELQKFERKNEKFASVLISNEEIEKNPHKSIKYNYFQADESFVNKVKPLLPIYERKYRQYILPEFDNNTTPEQAISFLQEKLKWLLTQDMKLVTTVNNTMEELLTLERKEIKFWRDMVDLNPKAIFEKVRITEPIPKWDKYNEFVDRLETLFKYKKINKRIYRDEIFCGENDLFVLEENNKYNLYQKGKEITEKILLQSFEPDYFG